MSAAVPVVVARKLPSSVQFPPGAGGHPLDVAVNKNLRALGVVPSGVCSDAVFLRRVCIDLMGALPPPEKVRAFLADNSPGKRAALVEWIFTRPEYADYWAMRWCDVLRVKSEFPGNLWPNAVQAYYTWLRNAVAANMPFDKMARELLLSSGSNFRVPPVNFYRVVQRRTPENMAAHAAVVFMGIRLDFDAAPRPALSGWSRAEALGLSAFFSNVRFKNTDEWKEEIVYFANGPASFKDPDSNEIVAMRFPGTKGPAAPVQNPGANPVVLFADWLVSPSNPWFSRHLANRYWAAIFGRGITVPVDDVGPRNPPSNQELLDLLAEHLVKAKYDPRALLSFIVNSQTYQRSCESNEWNRDDVQNWSYYRPRRLEAEVLADAIGALTGAYEAFSSSIPEPYAFWPDNFHAVQNPDASVTTAFLDIFGRPARDTSFDYERNHEASMAQALYLLNSAGLKGKLEKKNGTLQTLCSQYGENIPALAEVCYLTLLSRYPDEREKAAIARHFAGEPDRLKALQDLVWALVNAKEFLYNH
jgi:hypothetical protein